MNHPVAFAGPQFQRFLIEHGDASACVVDDPFMHQFLGGHGHTFASDTQQAGDDFMGHHNGVVIDAVERHEQHATQLLVQGVVPMARSNLRHLGDQGPRE